VYGDVAAVRDYAERAVRADLDDVASRRTEGKAGRGIENPSAIPRTPR
jgi:hypothetical protein